jgi:hypothetical protein
MTKKKVTVVKKTPTFTPSDVVKKVSAVGSQIMDKAIIAEHKIAAQYHEAAAKHHNKVLKHYENGNHAKVEANAAKANSFMNLLIKLKDDVKLYVSEK